MAQHHRLLECKGVPDLHLAVRAVEHWRLGPSKNNKYERNGNLLTISAEEEEKHGCLLNALEHALFCEVVGAVVIPNLHKKRCQEEMRGVVQRGWC